ncbi:MAG: UDP-N-acetylmuramoyl-tripeptide--D-alanyl-D-alanine ligase [Oscillospiraceae bacterium]|nr:UDP-N-acetylmuramoyl-tripeptide--D-alanyl-D-alanine ligase [Oscillospiraceae bacterium]
MLWIFSAAGYTASLVGCALAARFFLHMFQLNTYQPKAQRAWLRQNARRAPPLLLPLAGGFFFWPPKKGKVKKPLDITARLKRMIATLGLLFLLWTAVWVCLPLLWNGKVQAFQLLSAAWLPQILLPELILLANAINAPMEKAIRDHYTRDAMRMLREHPKLLIIGITGSYGKTSVKHFLYTLLRGKYNVLMTPGNKNTPMGVVKVIRESLSAAHEIFLCEMGAKKVGDIQEICDIVHPTHGVLTSVGPQHLETFFSLENVVSTKFELARSLPPEGILFANGEDANIRAELGRTGRDAVTYASQPGGGQYYAEEISVSERGTSFTAIAPDGEKERFTTGLIGRHNVINVVGAIAVAHALGVPLKELRGQVRKLQPVPHRLQLIDRGGGVLVIDDAYNANPSGAAAALATLALFEGCKILITPGMVELGEEEETRNAAFGAQAAVCDMIALVGVRRTEPIRRGALEAGFPPERLVCVDTLEEAMAKAMAYPMPGRKIILLENDLPDNY